VAGIVVSGFGLASVYAAPLTNWLVKLEGGVPQTMMFLGIAFLIAVVILSQFLRTPPAGYVPPGTKPPVASTVAKKDDFRPTEMLRTNQFYLLWFMYFCGAGAGLMIISKLKTIADQQAGLKLGFLLVASLAIGNGAGRILAGMLSDKLGRKPTIVGCLLFQALLMIVLTFATKGSALATMTVLAVVSALIGANYGANLALYPSVTKDYYGLKNFGVNYGFVFTAWGIGGFALSLLAGKLRDAYGTFSIACYVAAGLLVTAAIVAIYLRPPHHAAEEHAA
jgi:MFS transporter, OFA family, oxalate/formate antiporter